MRYLMHGEETARLLFRSINLKDFDKWLPFFEDPAASVHWQYEKQDAKTDCQQWYAKQFNRYEQDLGGMNALLEKESGHLVGHCGLLVQEIDGIKELEIAYSLLPAYWNRGYATEAAMHCKAYAFNNKFSSSLISIISLTNKPSENVALKNGMYLDKRTRYNNNEVNIFRIQASIVS